MKKAYFCFNCTEVSADWSCKLISESSGVGNNVSSTIGVSMWRRVTFFVCILSDYWNEEIYFMQEKLFMKYAPPPTPRSDQYKFWGFRNQWMILHRGYFSNPWLGETMAPFTHIALWEKSSCSCCIRIIQMQLHILGWLHMFFQDILIRWKKPMQLSQDNIITFLICSVHPYGFDVTQENRHQGRWLMPFYHWKLKSAIFSFHLGHSILFWREALHIL